MAEHNKPSLARLPNTFSLQVGTKAQKLVAENPKRKAFLVYNNGSATVYILSGPNKSKNDGIPVPIGETYNNDTCYGEFWIIAETGTQDVRIEEDTN